MEHCHHEVAGLVVSPVFFLPPAFGSFLSVRIIRIFILYVSLTPDI